MAYQNLNGNEKISESYGKINTNFAQVDTDITAHKTAATLDHPDGSVTTAKVADKAIVRAKIGDKAVGTGQIGDNAITVTQLANDAATDAVIGNRTANDTTTPSFTGPLTSLFSGLFALIKGITGKASALTAPATTLEATKAHMDDTVLHTTASEHSKLAGIAAGAEVNQNTFSTVSVSGQGDVVADSKTDTLNLAGGTGITITTDPTTDRIIWTATGTATPGAHASSHITGGSDVIPDAVTGGASGLMSGADATFVRSTGETKAGAQAKADAAAAASVPLTQKGAANGVATLDAAGKVPVGQLPTGIDAAKIGSGIVSNTEFGYLDGVTSAIQTQLNGKAAAANATSSAAGLMSAADKAKLDGVLNPWGDNTASQRAIVWAHRGGSNLPVSASTFTKVIFDSKPADNLSNYSASTGLFTASKPGWYRVKARLLMQSVASGAAVYLRAIHSSGAARDIGFARSSAAADLPVDGDILIYLAAGDTVYVDVYCNSATAVIAGDQFSRLEIICEAGG